MPIAARGLRRGAGGACSLLLSLPPARLIMVCALVLVGRRATAQHGVRPPSPLYAQRGPSAPPQPPESTSTEGLQLSALMTALGAERLWRDPVDTSCGDGLWGRAAALGRCLAPRQRAPEAAASMSAPLRRQAPTLGDAASAALLSLTPTAAY